MTATDTFKIRFQDFKGVVIQEDHKMKITDVRVRKVDTDSKMRAVASITIDDVFVVHDIKIIEGEKGLFIAMPSRKTATGGYRDIAHPINPEGRAMFEEAILEAYEKAEKIIDTILGDYAYIKKECNLSPFLFLNIKPRVIQGS
mgnify:CR=1 FL=1